MTPRNLRHPELPTVLPILLTTHAAQQEASAATGKHTPISPRHDDLPWLWIGGVPRMVPGAAAAYFAAESHAAGAQAAADITELWLMGLATLPAWGMRITDGAFHALTGTGKVPRRKAWIPPTMAIDGSSSGQRPRPIKEQRQAAATAVALAASAGPNGPGNTYPPILMSGPLARFLDELRRDREAATALYSAQSDSVRVLASIEKRLAQALGEASESDKMVTTEDAAAVEGVSADTIKKRCQRGTYPGARKRGGLWFIPLADLNGGKGDD